MVLSLVSLCAKEVVRDHCSGPHWLRCVPRELYGSLLEAAFTGCRPLAVDKLVRWWPERTLRVGGLRKTRKSPLNRYCIQALLLAVVRGLMEPRCALQVLDVCGLQCEEGGIGDSMGGWSLTVAVCTMVVQARVSTQKEKRRGGERERKRFRGMVIEKDLVERERAQEQKQVEEDAQSGNKCTETKEQVRNGEQANGMPGTSGEEHKIKGVRRRMEMERREGKVAGNSSDSEDIDTDNEVIIHVRADLFVNARSWDRMCLAMRTVGPLKLQCRYLRVEELSVSRIRTLLEYLPREGLLGVDIRYSSLGVVGLTELLPQLSIFPALSSLRLHYCNLDLHRDQPGQEGIVKDLSLGLAQLKQLSRLSLTALRLPGHLRILLSSLSKPLKILELPYLSLSPSDLAYLSSSQHASMLQQLDLSENRLDETTLPSVCRLLSQASGTLQQLCLSGCGLTDQLLRALLPSLSCCCALKSLGLALNPLSMAGLLDLVRATVRMPSLRQLLYPNPLEDYQPGLPDLPSSAQLLDWPLDKLMEVQATHSQLNRVVTESGRSDIFLTADLLDYGKDLVE